MRGSQNVEPNLSTELPEAPPFFKTWSRAYTVVLSELVILILLFYFLSRTFQ
jgi:hypothetical protein